MPKQKKRVTLKAVRVCGPDGSPSFYYKPFLISYCNRMQTTATGKNGQSHNSTHTKNMKTKKSKLVQYF